MRDELPGLAAFVAVAEKRSFRAAGELLRVTPSAVSQTVRQLEERLGLRLLARTTRSVALTEPGQHLYDGLKPSFANIQAALDSLNELRKQPAGTLRLSVSAIAESFLAEGTLAEFLAQYPDIKLELAIEDSESDIVQQGFDAGVRLGEVIDRDMVAVKISADQRQIVVASPGYLKQHGKPKHPRELQQHACIGWREFSKPAPYRWEFTENGKDFEVGIEGRVNTNEMSVMLRLARDGVGLTIGLEETFRECIERGELVPVLEKFCDPFPGFFLYYPSRTQTPAKLKALVDFLRARVRSSRRK
jgi:DNA-binding transcriptional LysR family regulator